MARAASTVEEIDRPSVTDETPAEPEISAHPEKTGFFEQLSKYTEEEWQSLLAWVYRLAPITDRLATGNKAVYVQKYGGFFDEDTLKHDLGSGTYRIQLNQTGPNGKAKPIRQFVVSIEDMKFPPKVPEGEWVDDPRNKRWAWCRKKEEAAPGGSQQNSWTPESVLRFVKDLRPDAPKEDHLTITKAVLDAVKETRTQMNEASDPMKMMGFVAQIVALLKPANDKPAGADPMFTLLFQQLADAREEAKSSRESAEKERQRNHEFQLKMMEQKTAAPDPMEMIDKVLNIKERLGGDEPERRNWKEKLVDEGMQHVPEILSLAKSVIGRPGYQNPQRPPQQTAANPAPPTQQPQPAVIHQQPTTQPQPQPSGESPVMPQPTLPSNLDTEVAWLANVFEGRGRDFVLAFAADPNGGGELADLIERYAGLAFYERIALMGRPKILEAIACLPQMKADLAAAGSAEMLDKFIDDFTDPDDDDDDDDDAPVIPEGDASRSAKPAKVAKGEKRQ